MSSQRTIKGMMHGTSHHVTQRLACTLHFWIGRFRQTVLEHLLVGSVIVNGVSSELKSLTNIGPKFNVFKHHLSWKHHRMSSKPFNVCSAHVYVPREKHHLCALLHSFINGRARDIYRLALVSVLKRFFESNSGRVRSWVRCNAFYFVFLRLTRVISGHFTTSLLPTVICRRYGNAFARRPTLWCEVTPPNNESVVTCIRGCFEQSPRHHRLAVKCETTTRHRNDFNPKFWET